MLNYTEVNSQSGEFAASTNMTAVEVPKAEAIGVVAAITVTTPSAGAFTAAATNICTKATHGMQTGLKVRVSTTDTLPSPLLAATDYFVIRLSANTFSLAETLVLAQAGTAIDITDTGTGTHTITPTAIAGGTFKLQGSQDNSTFFDLKDSAGAAITVNVTATANLYLEKTMPVLRYVRAVFTLTAGQISVVQTSVVKGY